MRRSTIVLPHPCQFQWPKISLASTVQMRGELDPCLAQSLYCWLRTTILCHTLGVQTLFQLFLTGGLLSAFSGESNVSQTGGWTTAVGIAFLAPYNLSAEHSTWSANGTRGPIHQAAAGLSIPIYYYQAAVDRQAADKQPR